MASSPVHARGSLLRQIAQNVLQICGILHQWCVKLLRSASIFCQIAALGIGFGSCCCVLHRFSMILLRSALVF